jgi:hypothetical protein
MSSRLWNQSLAGQEPFNVLTEIVEKGSYVTTPERCVSILDNLYICCSVIVVFPFRGKYEKLEGAYSKKVPEPVVSSKVVFQKLDFRKLASPVKVEKSHSENSTFRDLTRRHLSSPKSSANPNSMTSMLSIFIIGPNFRSHTSLASIQPISTN